MSACSGWILSVAALIAVITIYKQSKRSTSNEQQIQTRKQLLAISISTLILFMTNTMITLGVLAIGKLMACNSVSQCNLAGIGQGITSYCNDHGAYPNSPLDLVIACSVPHKQFIAPFDTKAHTPFDVNKYTSYAYVPGQGSKQNDPDIMLGYEREPFTMMSDRILFKKYGRWTLFDDGHVELLDEEHFQAAIRKDRQRRRELGWPSPDTQPASQPAK